MTIGAIELFDTAPKEPFKPVVEMLTNVTATHFKRVNRIEAVRPQITVRFFSRIRGWPAALLERPLVVQVLQVSPECLVLARAARGRLGNPSYNPWGMSSWPVDRS